MTLDFNGLHVFRQNDEFIHIGNLVVEEDLIVKIPNLVIDGNLVVKGNLNADSIESKKSISVFGDANCDYLKVKKSLTVTGDILNPKEIRVGENLFVQGGIDATKLEYFLVLGETDVLNNDW